MSGAGRNRQRGGPKQAGGNERNGRRDRGGSGTLRSSGSGAGTGAPKKYNDRKPQGERPASRERAEDIKKPNERGTAPKRSGSSGAPASRVGSNRVSGGGGHHPLLPMGRIKGEWMDIRLPDQLTGAPMSVISRHLPLPPKLVTKLLQTRGCVLHGPSLRLHLFPRETRDFPSDWMELNILYEDEFTLIVNKPAGIEVHPSEKGQRKTLAHAVAAYYEMSGQDVRIRHVHRIDKDTTGPVLYAKNEFAHYQYDKAMREKTIERIYVALAEGYVEGNKGRIDKPIGQDRHHSTRRRVSDTGDPAVTHYEVMERLSDHTLVRLRLETGRTHQIRVHMSSINHPLAGDGLYGGKRGVISRQALHGERLIWSHPWTGDKQQVSAPLPDDLIQALNKLRRKQD
ncbi:RluA family pseudouridine synthase [Cohnella luojiensis]|uniref:Pseudouridine synthase n=1 Tax=Cohnella luojiensis TaxID=652876 RepID=A0A4Y8LX90_9BACL|nr:RluA family pseudouridine synthase [Cohnella luojiensis]TFE25793.1 RluA family pseudouridine synthase [Cohnella luojiensis]